MLLRVAAALTAFSLPSAGEGAAARLPRIVSINPCVDAVLLKIADPRQIAAISHYSHDPRASAVPVALARRFRATSGTAEEVVALAPDLVLAGGHVDPSTIAALRRLRVRLVQIGVPASLAENEAQLRLIAGSIGRPGQGARLVGATRAALAQARSTDAIPALIWQGGGLVPGSGTLSDELLRATGFRNLSASYGLRQWDVLSLEHLVARPPRVLLSVDDTRGDRMLGHPVLRRLRGRMAVRAYPQRLLNCGGPTIIEAAARLATIRRSL